MNFLYNNKGMAMPAVLGIMLVISLLGTALWQYGVSDTIHVSKDEIRTQAYYVARSGADSALNGWIEAPMESKPSGTSNTFNFGPGSFQINITEHIPEDSQFQDWVKIESTGTVKDVSQKVTVTLDSNYKFGHDLDWYDYTSGKITDGEHDVYEGAVVLEALKLHKLKEPNDPTAVFKAIAMFFSSGIGIPFNENLDLHAETIVFYDNPIKMNKAGLTLHVLEGHGISREGISGLWGIVYFGPVYDDHNNLMGISNKAYYFPKVDGGIDITTLDEDDDYYPLVEIYPQPPKPSPSMYYNITWS